MADKKYIGNAYKGNFENNYRINITIAQLETALELPKNSLKNLIASVNYDKATDKFKNDALFVNKFTSKEGNEVKELTLKIEISQRRDGKLSVALNEFVPDSTKKTESKPAAQTSTKQAAKEDNPFGDDDDNDKKDSDKKDDNNDLPF